MWFYISRMFNINTISVLALFSIVFTTLIYLNDHSSSFIAYIGLMIMWCVVFCVSGVDKPNCKIAFESLKKTL